MIKTIFLILFLSLNIYGKYYNFSLKGGINYSTADYIVEETRKNNTITNKLVKTKYGKLLFLSLGTNLYQKFYLNIELGLNDKANAISLEMPIIIGYSILNHIDLYIGSYGSLVFADTSQGIFGFHALYNDNWNNDHGFLFGSKFIYKNFFFDFRYQKGYGNLMQSNEEQDSYKNYITDSQQFLFMIGYKFK